MYFTKWKNIDRCGFIESAITYHRFHLNIGLATGIRAAFAVLGALGVDRPNCAGAVERFFPLASENMIIAKV